MTFLPLALAALVLTLSASAAPADSAAAAAKPASIGGKGPARAARSVHLQWSAPECDAFYNEMIIEQSTPGSYFMACGWNAGYFGLQELGNGKKVALFSVWDNAPGDDPNVVKTEDRVEVLHQSPGVRIKRFGGEGTGGQCMIDWPWEIGQTNRFLVRAIAEDGKTAYAGYLFDPNQREWQHLVTFRTPSKSRLRGLYSFIEDFRRDSRSADEPRRARFQYGFIETAAGQKPIVQARFTASNAEWEARDTINAGTLEPAPFWYLSTGGATKREPALNSTLTVTNAAPPSSADLPVMKPTGSK